MTEIIVCEKPKAAQKIAAAIADGKVDKKVDNKVPYYELKRGGKKIIVVSAVGHLYGLSEKDGKKWTYPTFNVEWKPISQLDKNAAFSAKYLSLIVKLSKQADEFTIATDYDVEGEVIGLNILRFACKKKDANRMKFSTLTAPDLIEAYEHKQKHLDWGQANAGLTRHELDWYYGINISRALTNAIKTTGMWKILSTGRVQGPALKIIVDKEREISAFNPVPYWEIELKGNTKHGDIDAWHEKDKFFEKKDADLIMQKVKGKDGIIASLDKTEFKQKPPHPFDLTSLQIEAYRCFHISPVHTLSLAQELYTDGLISYPRTSSRQLPPAIGYKKLIQQISAQENYSDLCNMLLSMKQLTPNNGDKTDPAHPAIYPTGVKKPLEGRGAKLYDLIVRRFLATFGEEAVRETVTLKVDVNGEKFVQKGTRTKERGWHVYYGNLLPFGEEEVPAVDTDEGVKVESITMFDKQTQPPKRYTPASIIKDLEKRNLGTKATRASIVETLISRNYVHGDNSLKATDLGIQTVDTLLKYTPEILDEELTRGFEKDMDLIRDEKKTSDQILERARIVLTKTLQKFKLKDKIIGAELHNATKDTRDAMNTIGKCPKCGGTLMIKRSKFGRFVACDKYPECTVTLKIPSAGMIQGTEKICEICKYPFVKVIRKGKRPQELCSNVDCPSKVGELNEADYIGKKCPKCTEGGLIVRKSIFGRFVACNTFPKCRYIERLNPDGTPRVMKFAKKPVAEGAEISIDEPVAAVKTSRKTAAAAKTVKTVKSKTPAKKGVVKKISKKIIS